MSNQTFMLFGAVAVVAAYIAVNNFKDEN